MEDLPLRLVQSVNDVANFCVPLGEYLNTTMPSWAVHFCLFVTSERCLTALCVAEHCNVPAVVTVSKISFRVAVCRLITTHPALLARGSHACACVCSCVSMHVTEPQPLEQHSDSPLCYGLLVLQAAQAQAAPFLLYLGCF